RAADANYVRQQDREFFIAYAQTQRRKTSESALRKQVATDHHAPEDDRADTVRNLAAWTALCEHTARHSSELVLLPEFAMVEPVWQDETFDACRWAAAQALSDVW